MQAIVVNYRPLNDDTLYLADEGKVFPGNYVAILEYYTFANEWSDKKHTKAFLSHETMQKFINKRYPDFELHEVL